MSVFKGYMSTRLDTQRGVQVSWSKVGTVLYLNAVPWGGGNYLELRYSIFFVCGRLNERKGQARMQLYQRRPDYRIWLQPAIKLGNTIQISGKTNLPN